MKWLGIVCGGIALVVLVSCDDGLSSMEKEALGATVNLYNMNVKGSVRCTAFAFEKEGQTYRFLTAGHCAVDKEGKVLSTQVIGIKGWLKEYFSSAHLVVFDNKIVKNKKYHITDGFAVYEAKLPEGKTLKILPFSNEPATISRKLSLVSRLLIDPPVSRGRVVSSSDFWCAVSLGDSNYCSNMLFVAMKTNGGCSGSAVFDGKGVRGVYVHQIELGNDASIKTGKDIAGIIPSKFFLEFWGAYKSSQSCQKSFTDRGCQLFAR